MLKLGSTLTEDWRYEEEIKARTNMAKGAFNKNKRLFYSNMNLYMRKRLVKCTVM